MHHILKEVLIRWYFNHDNVTKVEFEMLVRQNIVFYANGICLLSAEAQEVVKEYFQQSSETCEGGGLDGGICLSPQ